MNAIKCLMAKMVLAITFISYNCVAQNYRVATFSYFDSAGASELENRYPLILNNIGGKFEFCCKYGYNEALEDTLVEGKKISVLKHFIDTTQGCNCQFGRYTFRKKGAFIYVGYFNYGSNLIFKHKQYPLNIGDTTNYMDLLSGPFYKSASTGGIAYFEKDTTIQSGKSISYTCYSIIEIATLSAHTKGQGKRRIFIDREHLLPVRIEYWSPKNELLSFYLADKLAFQK